jgi:hypothetical protein
MPAATPSRTLLVARATLLDAAGPLAAGATVSVRLGPEGIVLLGADPPAAWQIPLSTLAGARLASTKGATELAGWVAGGHLRLRFDAADVAGGSLDDMADLLGVAAPRHRAGTRQRGWWWLVAVVVVGLVVGLVGWLVWRSVDEHSAAATAADRAEAASVNLTSHGLPSDFQADDPTTSPLAGLLGTAPSSKPTEAERRTTAAIEDRYRSCMELTKASDREFGAAGVVPPVEEPGLPYGRIGASGDIEEVGTVTQRYATAADVAADHRQMAMPQFSTCFASALARFVAGSSTTPVATSRQHLIQPFGAWATGGTAVVELASSSGDVPVELGVTLLLSGRDEQYLYTFCSGGSFPAALRQQIVAEQGPRLAGLAGAKAA